MIIGASGEIGAMMCIYFHNHGYKVLPVTRTSKGPILARVNLQNVVYSQQSLDNLENAMMNVKVIVNLAIDKKEYYSDSKSLKMNVGFIDKLLSSIDNTGCSQFIQFSSISALTPKITNHTLSSNLYSEEIDWYTKTKVYSEKAIIQKSATDKNRKYLIIRPGVVYGPNMSWSKVAFQRMYHHPYLDLPTENGRCLAVHVYDLIRLTENAIINSNIGIINGINPEHLTWKDFYKTHGAMINAKGVVRISSMITYQANPSIVKELLLWLLYNPISKLYLIKNRTITRIGMSIIKTIKGERNTTREENIQDDSVSFSEQEYEMYKTDISSALIKKGVPKKFSYKVNYKVGIQNAAMWWKGQYV